MNDRSDGSRWFQMSPKASYYTQIYSDIVGTLHVNFSLYQDIRLFTFFSFLHDATPGCPARSFLTLVACVMGETFGWGVTQF